MSSGKLVTVYGATGTQGGSVVRSLLQNKSNAFSVRAITRNPDSGKARELASLGVDVVKADGHKREQVLEAFKGSWAVFVNTDSSDLALYEPSHKTESDLGKSIVDAAFEAGVDVFVYSGLASASLLSQGATPSRLFDEKHTIGTYAQAKGFKTAVVIAAGWYMENHTSRELAKLLGGFPYEDDADGYRTLRTPRWGGDGKMPLIAVEEDWGDLVHGVLLDPGSYDKQFIQGISDLVTPEDLTKLFQSVTGTRSRFVPVEDWKSFEMRGNPALGCICDMFGFLQLCQGRYFGMSNDLSEARKLKKSASAAKGLSKDKDELTDLDRFLNHHFVS
ncbi:hypothetical protein HIM_05283 [Hirsutella minnesotensis 3608]|uniref:NmrA-like domain-containing protein n=1 Tax=Hirsutella minnesotensis 3608 TaxID=1043627 RepID=A0A0F8A0I2_9HYPO|nr:hypothetical protein HIM_05283 [Hirsutella minnesotensis 3608]